MPDHHPLAPSAEQRVTITIEAVPFPAGEAARALLLDTLASRAEAWLTATGSPVEQDRVSVSTGYRYGQISDRCPLCDERIELLDLQADTENGAHASAACSGNECEWTGTAVYRLIDLEGGIGDAIESAVLTGDTTPSYYSY